MATITSNATGGGLWSATGTWAGGVVPVDTNDVVIAAGDVVTMDADTSGFAAGINSVLIQSHATNPGTLRWMDGYSGILKITSGSVVTNVIQGNSTSAVCKGRLLASEAGLWVGSTVTATASFAQSQSGTSGTVTDGGGAKRIFTPGVGQAWVVDALIGESMTINGSTYAIEDNDATTVTLTTGPAIGATVTSWALVIRPLPVARVSSILLGALSSVLTRYLDCAMYSAEPTTQSVRTYGTTDTFTVTDTTNDIITLDAASAVVAILTNTTPVFLSTSGTLPTGLDNTTLYYVRDVSGKTCKLYTTQTGGSAVNLTDTGTGTHAITVGRVPVSSTSGDYIQTSVPVLLTTAGATWADTLMVMFTGITTSNGPTITNGTHATIQPNIPYYIVSGSLAAGKFKIAESSGGTVLDLTDGSSWPAGMQAYIGGGSTAQKIIAVLDDVTADTKWVGSGTAKTFANCTTLSAAVLVDEGSVVYDQQRLAIQTITATTMTLGEAVDSALYPNARIWLMSRNVEIVSSCTSSVLIVANVNNTTGGRFGSIRSAAGTGVAFNGYGISAGSYCFASIISGCTGGIDSGSLNSATVICACSIGLGSITGATVATITGCSSGVNAGTSCVVTTIRGCSNALASCTSCVATTVIGCSTGISAGSANTATTIIGCSNGMASAYSGNATTISGCNYGFITCTNCAASVISGCTYGVAYGSNTLRGTIFTGNSQNIFTGNAVCYAAQFITNTTAGYRCTQTYTPYMGNNPFGVFSYDHQDTNGALYWMAQGGTGSSAAYVEGTHGDLQACGWAAPDPDWIHTSLSYADAIPIGAVACPNYIDIPINAVDGETVKFQCAIKPSTVSGWSQAPRLQLIDAGKGWNSGGTFAEVLSEDAHSLGGTTWELQTVTHTATADQHLAIRIVGTRSAINEGFDWCWRQVLDYPVVGDVKTGVSYGNAGYTGTYAGGGGGSAKIIGG
jgi:hypothetical protein